MGAKSYIVQEPTKILSNSDIDRIYSGALDVLETTGVVFQDNEALDILEKGGAIIDRGNQRARFPSFLVEHCLATTPAHFSIRSRDPGCDVRFGDPELYVGNFPGIDAYDFEKQKRRPATLQDYVDAVKILDSLESISLIYVPYGYISDRPPAMWGVHRFMSDLRNTNKFHLAVAYWENDKWLFPMARAIGGECITVASVAPPLTINYDMGTRPIIHSAREGFPIQLSSGLVYGSTSPVTLAGSLVQYVAEIFSGIILAQLVRPGIGVIAGNYSQPMDMKKANVAQGAIERSLFGMAFHQIFKYLKIPCGSPCSTDAKIPDYQCAQEKILQVLPAVMSGANGIIWEGSVYDELIFSPVIAIIDNEVMEMIERLLEGIRVDEESLAVDLIKSVGPIPGHFLNKNHTRLLWQGELYAPKLADRSTYPTWEAQGSKGIVEKALDMYKTILENHKPVSLSASEEDELEKIMKEAEAYYKKTGRL
jgi:trimethylamine--corrinoid protein Co-methyltransferase